MPWRETDGMEQREKFIRHWKRRDMPFVRLCDAYGISRKTGYKWLGRYDQGGLAALEDRSRAPLTSPQAIADEVRKILLQVRLKHPFWGPRKVLWWLEEHRPNVPLPAASTVGELFKKQGLVRARRRRSRLPPRTQPFEAITAPNDTWCTDFKGEFRVGDGEVCYPLTITDAFSRYLIKSHGLPGGGGRSRRCLSRPGGPSGGRGRTASASRWCGSSESPPQRQLAL